MTQDQRVNAVRDQHERVDTVGLTLVRQRQVLQRHDESLFGNSLARMQHHEVSACWHQQEVLERE